MKLITPSKPRPALSLPNGPARLISFLALLLLAVVSAVVLPAATARAEVKVAVASPSRIFNDMKETKDLQAKMTEDQKKFAATSAEKQNSLKTLQGQVVGLSGPQHDQLNDQFIQQSIEFKVWVDSQRAIAEHTQKRQMKLLFEKIQNAIGEIAKRDGIDLVIADNKDPLPNDQELEQVDIRALRQAILQKDVLFSNPKLDISDAVLALLDARYRAGGGAAVAPTALPMPVAPAGTPTPTLINPTTPNK